MKHSKMIMSQLLLLCFFVTSCSSSYTAKSPEGKDYKTASSQTIKGDAKNFRLPAQEAEDEETKNIGSVLKEIYVKGSIDGKSLFMVYGFENAFKDMKKVMKNSVNMENIVDLGQAFYDKGHDEDYVNAVKEGADVSKDLAKSLKDDYKNIFKWPFKSIKRMQKSYKVSFDNARDSYYNANNQISGSVKYAGHAIWANVKGAYYLVVEIPTVTAAALGVTTFEAVGTALAVPVAVVLQTLKVAWRATVVAFQFGIVLPAKAAVAAVEGAYATLSTTTAATLTLAAAGGLAIFKGTKWLVYTLPHRLFSPVSVQAQSDVPVGEQEDFAKKVKSSLEETVLGHGLKLSVSEIKEYTSKFVLSSDKVEKAVAISLGIHDKQVKISAEATKKFLKTVEGSKEERNKEIEKLLKDLVDHMLELKK